MDKINIILDTTLNIMTPDHVNKADLTDLLKKLWGFERFRDGQFELIKGALMGKNMLGILPTGAGKSLCYQLPALLGDGVSLIVSPRKSLINDQITNLTNMGFEFVDYIDPLKSEDETQKTFSRFQTGRLKILYVSPETLQMRDFQRALKEALKKLSLDYLIIDEAHCVSEWGHDFRPSYLKLLEVVTTIDAATVIAVTATASSKVKEDILNFFKIKEDNVVCSKPLDRPEVSLEVINLPIESGKEMALRKSLIEDIPRILHKKTIHELHQDGSGMIFTIFAKAKGSTTRSYGTKYILNEVRESGIDSNLYHSKLSDLEQSKMQDHFKTNQFPLLVTTMGFGMGIDKSNIRYIVHMCYSNSLEAYYQEVGRVGRDGQHAHALIISRDRTSACIQHQDSINNYEPQCIYGWRCIYTHGTKCDYGMQAKLISDNYPSVNDMTRHLNECYQFLAQNWKGNPKFTFAVDSMNSRKYQTYLSYFQRQGIIVDYNTLSYLDEGHMNFEVEVNQSAFIVSNLASVIDPIVTRLQSIKRRRYNMLESIWEYVNHSAEGRRQFLLDYFQNPVTYGIDGCKFCDVEGINDDPSIVATRALRINQLYKDYHNLMDSNSFDYENVNKLLRMMYEENEQESAKNRAMKHLEDHTDNPVALYFRSLMTLKRDKTDTFARNQACELVSLILKNIGARAASGVLNDFSDIDEKIAEKILMMNETINNRCGRCHLFDARIKGRYSKRNCLQVIY
ncbi:MAG TPA: RecQ family ATP-dependent DNA helicase [Desulfosporosinus sp.]|nr:RecQ family ATP-dependent DNA helicase [Desulfosporosinus sp.]